MSSGTGEVFAGRLWAMDRWYMFVSSTGVADKRV